MAKYAQLTATGLPHGVLLTIKDSTGKQVSNLYPEANANAPDNRPRFADGTGAIDPAAYVPNGTYTVAYSGGSQTVVVSGASGTPAESIFIDLATQAELDAAGTAASGTYGMVFQTPAALLASTQAALGTGTRWVAGRYLYAEAASGASDQHVTTAGGVKLYVVAKNGAVELDAWGVTSSTTDVNAQLTQAATVARKILLGSSTYNLATHATIDADLIGTWAQDGASGGTTINLTMGSGVGLTMQPTRRIVGVRFTSPFTGPASAGDAVPSGSGGNYDYGARCIELNEYCHVEDVELGNMAAGFHVVGPRVTGRRLHIKNIRQYQGWGSALHLDSTSTIYAHFQDLFFDSCDRGIEVEAGASHNLFERGLLQNIGPAGYTGQPAGAGYANYTFVLDAHSHTGEAACQGNTYRDFRLYGCMGGITAAHSSGTLDSELPRNNVWHNVTIEGRVGTTGFQSVFIQGHGNRVTNLRLLPGAGVTSMMNVLIADDTNITQNNEVEIGEATGYMLPLVKIGTAGNGRGNKVTLRRIFNPAAGTPSDWLVDVNHPGSLVDLDVQNVVGSVGYCRLNSTANYSRIVGYYSVLSGTSMTQALRLAGAKNAEIDVVGVAGASGVIDVYATNSTTSLTVTATVDRTVAGVAVNFDSTTSGCRLTTGSDFGTGTITNAGTGNSRGPYPLLVSPAGRFIVLSGPSVGTSNTLGNGTLRLQPFYVGTTMVVDQLGSEITVVGDAGCVLRVGVFSDAGGLPGSPLIDTTIPGDAVAVALATLGTAVTLTPGWYWSGGVVQGVTVTQPTVRTSGISGANYPMVASTAAGVEQSAVIAQIKGSVTGALSAFGTTPSPSALTPRVVARLAA